jgi:hypothetical protein
VVKLSVIGLLALWGASGTPAYARHKENLANPDDPTVRLFQLLDDSYGGKLTDFRVIADAYANPTQLGQMFQHVLQVNYDKGRFYGRLTISVRGVSQLTPEQLKQYTAQEIYGFGSEVAKFEKINSGPSAKRRPLFPANRPRHPRAGPRYRYCQTSVRSVPTQYIPPALEKNQR